jgi:hypothetical protein
MILHLFTAPRKRNDQRKYHIIIATKVHAKIRVIIPSRSTPEPSSGPALRMINMKAASQPIGELL